MQINFKWFMVSIALLMATAGSFLVGTYIGVHEYIKHDGALAAESKAFGAAVVLDAYRSGDTNSAIRRLEADLDSAIVEFGVAKKERPIFPHFIPGIALIIEKGRDRKLMKFVAQYRKQYPSPTEDESLRKFMANTLNPFE